MLLLISHATQNALHTQEIETIEQKIEIDNAFECRLIDIVMFKLSL